MLCIGDIHGNIRHYLKVLKQADPAQVTVQLGDFGVGFINDAMTEAVSRVHDTGNHLWFRGNHDDPGRCREVSGYVPDGHYLESDEAMVVGGAWSIDYRWRTPGWDWWPDEEISHATYTTIRQDYETYKPRIMLTHDAPSFVSYQMFCAGTPKTHIKTFTGQVLQDLLDTHAPDLWVFGHWHETRRWKLGSTEFVCLDELDTLDTETGEIVPFEERLARP